MIWIAQINTTEGDWLRVGVPASNGKDAIEAAYDYAEAEGIPVDNITVDFYDVMTHGDLSDYEILD